MRAILLAAGLGTRLRPLTENIPKCLVPIKGVPLLEIWLEKLNKAGITDILINTHYLAEQVNKYILGSKYIDYVELTYESKLIGTAGTLLENIDYFRGEDGLVLHADNYCAEDLDLFIAAHKSRPKGCLITMMTFKTSNTSSCGIVDLDEKNVVVGFYEKVKNPPGNTANGAIFIFTSEALEIISKKYNNSTDISRDILSKFIGKIYTYETKKLFLDIGSIENYRRANQ